MIACFRRFRKRQLRQLIMMCFVLSVIKVYWESLDSNMSNDVKSNSRHMLSNLNFISASLTISYDEARKFSNHRYLINHEQKCVDRDVLLLLFIKSSPGHFERRQAIRSTWGNEDYIKSNLGVNTRVLFALGVHHQPLNRTKFQQRLFRENHVYQDLIQQDFLDTFQNLTIKLLLQLGWTHAYCDNARFLMSADDDTFVHMPNLINYLKEVNQTSVKDFWVGNVNHGSPPSRDESSKYYVSHELYPWAVYPDYTSGAAYVVSRDVASKIYQASLTLNASIHIDDVFMGICANVVGVLPREHVFFTGVGKAPKHACIYNQMMTTHRHVEDLHEIWNLTTDPTVQQVSAGLFGKLYCTIVKMRLLCALFTFNTYPCKAAFL